MKIRKNDKPLGPTQKANENDRSQPRLYPVCSVTSYRNPQQRALGEWRTEMTWDIGLYGGIECI